MSGIFIAGILTTLALIITCTVWFIRQHNQNSNWGQHFDPPGSPPSSKESVEAAPSDSFTPAVLLATATMEESDVLYSGNVPADPKKVADNHNIAQEKLPAIEVEEIAVLSIPKDEHSAYGMKEKVEPQVVEAILETDPAREVAGSTNGKEVQVSETGSWQERLGVLENGVVSEKTDGAVTVMGRSLENSRSMRGGGFGMEPLVRAEVVIGEATRQILVETNVTLNQCAIKVRNITAEIRELSAELILDKVIIQGVLHKQIFFVGEDNIVHHQAEDVPFSTFVEVAGAEPGHNVQIHPIIETVIFTLLNCTLLHQKVVIEFFIKVTETRQLNILEGEGPLVRVDKVVGDATKQELIENMITLAKPAIKIDDITAEIRNLSVDVIEDKVVVQGVVHKQIFYVGTDNIEYHQGEDVEFSTFVDIPGATPGMDVVVEPTIEFIHFELLNPTTLLQKVVVEFFIKVTESVQINVELGPGALLKLDTVVGERTSQILVESIVKLNQPAVKVREIMARVEKITAEVIEDKVIIQGFVHKQIFFINEDNLEVHQAEDVPFSTFVDLPGAAKGMDVRIEPIIETILFELLDVCTLRQKVVIEFFIKVTESQQLQVELVAPYGPYYL